MNADVAVVVPTCGRPATLGRALRSVLAQTLAPREMIVVDDGPDAATEAIVRAFDDPRLRYLQTTGRTGAARARNLGVCETRSSWLAFHDDDDEWLPFRLQRQFEALATLPSSVGFVCCAYLVLPHTEAPRLYAPSAAMSMQRWDPAALYSFHFITPTWLIRRDVFDEVGGFDEAMPNLEDWEMAFRLHGCTGFHIVAEPLIVKHGGHGSYNSNPQARLASFRRILAKHAAVWRDTPGVLAQLHAEIGKLSCRVGDFAAARAAALSALRLATSNRDALTVLAAASLGGLPYRLFKRRPT